MKVYIHVHRQDRPGKCYWVCTVEGRVSGLHPDFGMADVYDAREVPTIAVSMCEQFRVGMEFIQVAVSQPDAVPKPIRALVGLD